MAPTAGRFARPERRWDCRRGTPRTNTDLYCNAYLKRNLGIVEGRIFPQGPRVRLKPC